MIITMMCRHDDVVSSYFIWRQQQSGDDASQYFIRLQFNEIASGCQMNFGLARKNTGLPSLHFWLFQCIFLRFKNAYFPLSSIAYFSVSKAFMCSTAAALIRIYMVSVGGSDWTSHHLLRHLHQHHFHGHHDRKVELMLGSFWSISRIREMSAPREIHGINLWETFPREWRRRLQPLKHPQISLPCHFYRSFFSVIRRRSHFASPLVHYFL